MNTRNQFTSEEWNTLVEAPIKAGRAMIFASPSGPIGVVKETMVLFKSIKNVTKTPSQSPFLDTLGKQLHNRLNAAKEIGDTLLSDLQSSTAPEETRTTAITACQAVPALLNRVTPNEAAAYKQFILSTANKVAEATDEGDVIGVRQEKVSQAEQSLLKDLKGALGVPS
jgi:hypothetical protein